MHLCDGLYAQAAFSFSVELGLRGLAALMAMRARCQEASAPGQAAPGSFEQRVRIAIKEAQLGCGAPLKFYFKTRVRIGGTREVCTPTQADLSAALRQGRRLRACLAAPDPAAGAARRPAALAARGLRARPPWR